MRRSPFFNRFLPTAASLVVLVACGDVESIEFTNESIANEPTGPAGTRMEGVRFSYSERGEILHVIRAGVLVRTGAPDDGEDSDVIHVSNGFTMYIEGDENTHQAQLSASRGKLDEAAMRLVAEDDVVLKNTDGDRLETEYLVWAHDSDRVHTDRPVAIYTSNGVIFGKGLESDARFESYRILQPSGEIPIDLSSR